MPTRVDPDLLSNLKSFGVSEAATCFNCGNCTAVCVLSSGSTPFPRKMMRYLQLGLSDRLQRSADPWLCYYCGDCSKTCPRQADPGEVMMGLRRYLTSGYEPTGIARLFYRSNRFATVASLLLACTLGLLLLLSGPAHTGKASPVARWLFGLIDYHYIEYLGVAVFALVALSMIGGVVRIITSLSGGLTAPNTENTASGGAGRFVQAGLRVIREIFLLKRYQTCDAENEQVWYLKPWFVHGAIMWGFMGLSLATALNIPLLGLKDPNLDTWLPSRVLGILAGLALMYGTTVTLISRISKNDKRFENSRFSDWLFLGLLWGLGVTGFWLTASIYFSPGRTLAQVVLLVHTVMAMELLLLFAFSKFAHVAYRPIALFFYFLRQDA